MDYKEKAMSLFKEGYNCSQAVFLTFSDELGIDRDTALKLSSSFGGGMGRLREVCGAVSGMFMVAGLKEGYSEPDDQEGKRATVTLAAPVSDQELKDAVTEAGYEVVSIQ